MDISTVTQSLAALAQETRLRIFRVLLEYGRTGLAAGKLAGRLGIPHNTLSFHLSQLKQAGLVSATKNGRQLIYAANTDAVEHLIAYLRENCCIHEDGETSACSAQFSPPAMPRDRSMRAGDSEQALAVMFLCTGNSCRSIMAEALLAHHGRGRVTALSAGSHPTGEVHPVSLATLAARGMDTAQCRSKSWDDLAGARIDIVITLCDAAANEACPLFAGAPLKAHWGVEDPARAQGSPSQISSFNNTCDQLEARVLALLKLPLETMDSAEIQTKINEIGQI